MRNEIIANSCRICLTQTKKLRSLYKPIEEGDEPPNEMLHLITGIQVEKLDEHETLPKNICKNCELSLSMAFEFRENALNTQQIIASYLIELNGYESNEDSNKSHISNYKTEYEEIMNLEPLDCVDALEEEIQILTKDEHKSSLVNEEELNETTANDEDDTVEEDEQEYYKQQEQDFILKDPQENEDEIEHENYSDHQQDEQYEEQGDDNEEHQQTVCDEQEEIECKEDQLNMSTEEENYKHIPKSVTKTRSSKANRKRASKIKPKPLEKLLENNSMRNMKLIPRRGRKPTNTSNQTGHICDICGNVFAKLGRMMEHRQRHDKEHRYCCEICDQTFLTRELLRKHMFSHSGGKPLKCKYCSRTFYYESVRRAHEAIHQGHKPFICDVCDKAFGYAHALKKHKLIHAEIKLYRCEYCSKDFRLQHHLKQHEMTKLHQNAVRFAHGGTVYEDCPDMMTGEQDLNDDILFIEEIADDQLASAS